MAARRSSKGPVWRVEQMADGLASWRLYTGPRARQWSAEVHPSAAGYVASYSWRRVRRLSRVAHAYVSPEHAMVAVEDFVLRERLRGAAAASRWAILEAMPAPAHIVARSPVWLIRCYDSGTMHLRGGRCRAWVHREDGTWRWFAYGGMPSPNGTATTRREAMSAVEVALRLSGHERLHAREALCEHLARLHALTRENVRRGRARVWRAGV